MRLIVTLALAVCVVATLGAPQDYRTTPVPILKQINRHNDDGSYSYGYEGADGTFKIETKYPTGEVYGKYGYIGDDGKLREIEYGASKRGFEPAGADINVAPPTLTNSIDETNADYDDGQYREDPSIYYKKSSSSKNVFSNQRFPAATATPAPIAAPVAAPVYQTPKPQYYRTQYNHPQYQQPQYNQLQYNQPQYYQQQYRPQPQYYNPQPRYQPVAYDPAIFSGHPATNFDINTGSYSISY